jgi:hypothetical protein
MQMRMALSLSLLFLIEAAPAVAGQIDVSDFGRHVNIETFESLADMTGSLIEPLFLDGNTYTTSSGIIRLFPPTETSTSQVCLGGPLEGHAPNPGTCIGTGGEDLETMEIALGTPSIRAGLWVGLTERLSEPQFWSSAYVRFFDENDVMLGSIFVSGPGFGFAGWEIDLPVRRSRIARIEVEDVAENNRVVVIDNVMWETRPPGAPESRDR